MIELLVGYLCFATSAALISIFKIFIPVRQLIIEKGLTDHLFVTEPKLASFIWFLIAIVAFPIIVVAIIDDEKTKAFTEGVIEGVLENDRS